MLPDNFPLTQNKLDNIAERLSGVTSYKGMGVAGAMRDLKNVHGALMWMLDKYSKWEAKWTNEKAQADALKAYLTQTEAVLAAYATGNWDGGAAANQLMTNLPQIP